MYFLLRKKILTNTFNLCHAFYILNGPQNCWIVDDDPEKLGWSHVSPHSKLPSKDGAILHSEIQHNIFLGWFAEGPRWRDKDINQPMDFFLRKICQVYKKFTTKMDQRAKKPAQFETHSMGKD